MYFWVQLNARPNSVNVEKLSWYPTLQDTTTNNASVCCGMKKIPQSWFYLAIIGVMEVYSITPSPR